MNTSPLVGLGKIGCIDLLSDLADILIVPHAVATEVRSFSRADPSKRWIDQVGSRFVRDSIPIDSAILSWDLGKGESEVLAHVQLMPNLEAIIDDGAARICAKQLGLPFRGTIGFLLQAKKEGRIERIKPKLLDLSAAGLYLDDRIIQKALEMAREI